MLSYDVLAAKNLRRSTFTVGGSIASMDANVALVQ